MKSNSESAKAFTLVELLVVIAILGILLALLLPVLSRAKARARLTQCQNNLKQIGQAMRMYLDANGTWPNHPFRLQEFSQKFNEASFHEPPTHSSIWYCPSWKDGVGRDALGNYLLNLNGSGDVNFFAARSADKPLGIGSGPGGSRGRREQEIVNPADMIVMGEMCETKFFISPPPRFRANFPFNRSYGYCFLFRHNERANSLFGEGHVESANREGLIGKADSIRRRWNYDNQPHDENWR